MRLLSLLLALAVTIVLPGSSAGCRRGPADPTPPASATEAPPVVARPPPTDLPETDEPAPKPRPQHDPDAGLDEPQILGLADIGTLSGWHYATVCSMPAWRTRHLKTTPKAAFRVVSPGGLPAAMVARELDRQSAELLGCCFAGYGSDRIDGSAELAVAASGSVTKVGQIRSSTHLVPDRFRCVQGAFLHATFGLTKGNAMAVTVAFSGDPVRVE